MKRISLEETDSTNRYAKALTTHRGETVLVTAEFQTAGRGSGSNTWESQAGKNLTFSLMAHPTALPASRMFVISEVTSLALLDALSTLAEGFSIKWPNDVYHHDRKLLGMLIENDLSGKYVQRTIIGIGLNVNQTHFLSDAPNPVSLAQILGREVDRHQVMELFLDRFRQRWQQMEQGDFTQLHTHYLQHLYRRDTTARFLDAQGTFTGRIRDVEPSGHLVVESQGETRRYEFKEIKFII